VPGDDDDSSDDDDSATPEWVWADAHQALVRACAPCHVTGVRAGMGPLLDPDEAWSMLIGVPSSQSGLPRIDPYAPDSSYLLAKVEGRQEELGGSGSSMPPPSRPQLPADEAALLRDWIARGAPLD